MDRDRLAREAARRGLSLVEQEPWLLAWRLLIEEGREQARCIWTETLQNGVQLQALTHRAVTIFAGAKHLACRAGAELHAQWAGALCDVCEEWYKGRSMGMQFNILSREGLEAPIPPYIYNPWIELYEGILDTAFKNDAHYPQIKTLAKSLHAYTEALPKAPREF